MPAVRRVRTTAAAVALATLGLSACGAGAGAPEGWTRVEDGWLAVDVPDAWTDTGPSAEWWTRSWQDDADEAQATVQMLAAPAFGYWGALEGQGVAIAGAQVGGLAGFSVEERTTPVDTDSLEVVRTDFTYEGADQEMVGVLWVAADPGTKKTVAVQLTGTELPEDVVEQVQSSIEVLDTDAEPTSV